MSSLIEWYRGFLHRRREANIAKWERQRTKGKFYNVVRMALIFGGKFTAIFLVVRYPFEDPITPEYLLSTVAFVIVCSIVFSIAAWRSNEADFLKRNPPDTGE